MKTSDHESDIIAWATTQATLLRARRFDELDVEHIADEIMSVAFAERRVIGRRFSGLIAELLRWESKSAGRSKAWAQSIQLQRQTLNSCIHCTPSIRASFADPDWLAVVWADAVIEAVEKVYANEIGEEMPWSIDQVLDSSYLPD